MKALLVVQSLLLSLFIADAGVDGQKDGHQGALRKRLFDTSITNKANHARRIKGQTSGGAEEPSERSLQVLTAVTTATNVASMPTAEPGIEPPGTATNNLVSTTGLVESTGIVESTDTEPPTSAPLVDSATAQRTSAPTGLVDSTGSNLVESAATELPTSAPTGKKGKGKASGSGSTVMMTIPGVSAIASATSVGTFSSTSMPKGKKKSRRT